MSRLTGNPPDDPRPLKQKVMERDYDDDNDDSTPPDVVLGEPKDPFWVRAVRFLTVLSLVGLLYVLYSQLSWSVGES